MKSEEIKFEIVEDLTRPYRLSLKAQIALYVLSLIFTVVILYYIPVPLSLEMKIMYFVAVAAIIYPYTIKIINALSESLALSLYVGAMFAIIYVLLKIYSPASLREVMMLLIFLEVLGVELLNHLFNRFRWSRSKWMYVLAGVLAAIFFVALFTILNIPTLGSFIALIISAVFSVVFYYAIIPERPF